MSQRPSNCAPLLGPLAAYWHQFRIHKYIPFSLRMRSDSGQTTPDSNARSLKGQKLKWTACTARTYYQPKQRSTPLISLLNLSIIHWSLRKNVTQELIHLFLIESCAKQQIKLMTCTRQGSLLRFQQNSTANFT